MYKCGMSTTITVSRETKRLLDSLRRGRTWDEFLRELALEYRKARARRALDELRKTASKRDLSYSETRLKLELK
mgnify:CR=1 FL=1